MKGTNTYAERNSIPNNQGEDIFLEWCHEKGLNVRRLGFDEKNTPVERFYDLPYFLRNLPDFLVMNSRKTTLVNVKGSLNLKEQEYENLDKIRELFETERVELYYAFCLPSGIIWANTDKVKEAYRVSENQGVWPDGKVYRRLAL
jgi:hypothetical protein